MTVEVLGVDLGHDERHVRVRPEAARLVDHGRPGGDGLGRELPADGAAGREEGEVDTGEGRLFEAAHLELLALERQAAPGRALAGEQAQLGDGEVALLEDRADGPADHAGGADDGDRVGAPAHQDEPFSADSG